MQLKPREYFTIARGLEDHTDNTVYYVRATIRNARTDVLLDTVDLVNQGDNHRYSTAWQVPADSSGEGFYVLITTSVYTDAAYTTKSTAYADKYDEHLVAERINPNLAQSGGSDINYKKIREIIKEEVANAEKPKEVDFTPIIQAIQSIPEVEIPEYPEQKETDLSPLSNAIEIVKKSLDKLHEKMDKIQIGEIKETLHETVEEMKDAADFNKVKVFHEEMKVDFQQVKDEMEKMLKIIREFFLDDMEAIKGSLGNLESNMNIKKAVDTLGKSLEQLIKKDNE